MEKLNIAATGRWLSLVCASLGILVFTPRSASAQSALTWARVELTRNNVQLYTNGQSRAARVADMLGVDDALSTANRSRAELRFNDGSLARIGESAVFRFTPNTRNFRLSNGTVLLLIPPGQGRTTIQTPNAVTGIHGSALFVRFVPETGTTIIGALTNNPEGPMMAFNHDATEQKPLYAGDMAVLQADGTLHLFSFDLEEFLATSDLMSGLDVNNLDQPMGDEAIDAVRQEIHDALAQQEQFDDGDDVVENPAFLSASINAPAARTRAIPAFDVSPAAAFLQRNTLNGGFESAVSATVNQPIREPVLPPVPPATPPPGGPVVKPPAPAPTPGPVAGPPIKPESIPNQPVVQPVVPETVVPETTIPVVPTEQPAPEQPATPQITVVPEAPTVTPEIIPIEKPTELPNVIVPEETTVLTPEVISPPIESVIEPETEVQIDRLPENVVVEAAEPPGQVGATPGQSGAEPPGQVGATPGQGGNIN